MRNVLKSFIFPGILLILAIICSMITAQSSNQTHESSGGQGMITVKNEQGKNVKRQFSFKARREPDGSVSGQAVLHNATFSGADGKTYQAQFDISCLKVVENTALVGGFVKRTNDPNLIEAAFFTVQDNGEPGQDDKISSVYFFDTDPKTTGSRALCESHSVNDFPLMDIDSGNIMVDNSGAE
jgi:hypothetical protein